MATFAGVVRREVCVCVCLNSLPQNCHLPLTLAGRRQLGKALMKERGENEQEEGKKKGLRRENN